ncbi:MAG TPA: PQQ-binding-like beta-propeller repeat protein [Candidatus Polarisedimenticolaceae bacterium]|nr:PQQ-binding-like beta-propeller repeat protein [Candidatus Polarisedimenticolaceae bacterium]
MGASEEQGRSHRRRPTAGRVRVWPAVAIAVTLGGGLVWIWAFYGEQRQSRVLATIAACGLAAVGWLVWLVAFSGLRRRTRLLAVGGIVLLVAVLALSLERRGLTGDALPLFSWRFATSGAGPAVPEARPAAARSADAESDYPQFLGPRRDATLPGRRFATDWRSHPPRELWRRPIGAGWSGFAIAGPYAVTQEQRGDSELVTGYDLRTGRLLWVHRDRTRHDDPLGGPGPRATPSIADGRVFAVGGTGRLQVLELHTGTSLWGLDLLRETGAAPPQYGVAGRRFRIAGDRVEGMHAELSWESSALEAKFTNVVLHQGHLYGLDDGILVAVDVADGRRVWKKGRYGHGQLVLVGDVLLIQAESGDVVIVRATPTGHEELGRLAAIDGRTWNHPAVAGRLLLVRNDREAACFELVSANEERENDGGHG